MVIFVNGKENRGQVGEGPTNVIMASLRVGDCRGWVAPETVQLIVLILWKFEILPLTAF